MLIASKNLVYQYSRDFLEHQVSAAKDVATTVTDWGVELHPRHNRSMSPTIRPYAPGDEEAINGVIRSVFGEYGWLWDPATENKDTADIPRYYHQRGGGFWVLEVDGAVVGTVGLRGEGERCTLYRLYLRREARGRGFGRSLYRFAIEQAVGRGYREMEIWSDKTLDVSHIMYRNSGAASLGERRVDDPDYGVPYEEWGYLLDLTQAAACREESSAPY